MLLDTWLEIVADWKDVFAQARTTRRAVRQALGSLVCLGRRTLSRVIWTNGGEQRSWSAEYFLHSRAECCLPPSRRRARRFPRRAASSTTSPG